MNFKWVNEINDTYFMFHCSTINLDLWTSDPVIIWLFLADVEDAMRL